MSWSNEEAERVKSLEIFHAELSRSVKRMDDKLDELLVLKHKGLGAFWMASIFIGAIFSGLAFFVSNFFKGH